MFLWFAACGVCFVVCVGLVAGFCVWVLLDFCECSVGVLCCGFRLLGEFGFCFGFVYVFLVFG